MRTALAIGVGFWLGRQWYLHYHKQELAQLKDQYERILQAQETPQETVTTLIT